MSESKIRVVDSNDTDLVEELSARMPAAANDTRRCLAVADYDQCSRTKGHSGLHAVHSNWGRNGKVRRYWVRGD